MFSLIITIISIALVAALALAVIYCGNSSFSKRGPKATDKDYIDLMAVLSLTTPYHF